MNELHQQLYIESIKLLYQDSNGRSSLDQAELAAAAYAMAETLYDQYYILYIRSIKDKCS